jgi:hypothetical protein
MVTMEKTTPERIKNFGLFFVLLFFTGCQYSGPSDLRENAARKPALPDSRELAPFVLGPNATGLNYVQSLLRSFASASTYTSINDDVMRSLIPQGLSYTGDIRTINFLAAKSLPPYDQLNDTAYLNRFSRKPISLFPAADEIVEAAKHADVIMFNEAHDSPQSRSFLTSLLSRLRDAGFECLAMETFSHEGSLASLDESTGYFTCEPSSGEIVREALKLGMKLIPYESRNSSEFPPVKKVNMREVEQAENLYRAISKPGGGVKRTVVLAGYGHISEVYFDTSFVSMAMNFKRISGIDPITVEQTAFLENVSTYGHRLLAKLYPDTGVSVVSPADLYRFGLDTAGQDLYLYHPPTKYIHNRPNWLLNLPSKKFVPVKMPRKLKKPVLAQAYFTKEITAEKDYQRKVPADQTFTVDDGYLWFALLVGEQYTIVIRDAKNAVIYSEPVKTRDK